MMLVLGWFLLLCSSWNESVIGSCSVPTSGTLSPLSGEEGVSSSSSSTSTISAMTTYRIVGVSVRPVDYRTHPFFVTPLKWRRVSSLYGTQSG